MNPKIRILIFLIFILNMVACSSPSQPMITETPNKNTKFNVSGDPIFFFQPAHHVSAVTLTWACAAPQLMKIDNPI